MHSTREAGSGRLADRLRSGGFEIWRCPDWAWVGLQLGFNVWGLGFRLGMLGAPFWGLGFRLQSSWDPLEGSGPRAGRMSKDLFRA